MIRNNRIGPNSYYMKPESNQISTVRVWIRALQHIFTLKFFFYQF
jgi:hypothetical protein